MRIKAIMVGAIAALALATLTANAGTTATPRVSGSLVSLVAATTTVTKAADAEAVAAATRRAATEKASEPSEKPVVAIIKSAPSAVQLSAACQQAIDTLKAMRQTDVAEDTAERGQQPLSAAAIAADRAEDLAEVQPWSKALMAARTACMPTPTAACQTALASLKALVPASRPEEWSDLVKLPNQMDLTGLRAALTAVAMACGHRD